MVNMLCCLQRQFFVSLLLPLVVSAQSRYTNSSSQPCTSCTVTATEFFLTYPLPVTSTTVSVTVSKIPYVTIHTDGSSETNYRTVTQSLNVTETFTGTGSVDPHASLTWEVAGVVLTYPTTYVSMIGFSGGLFTPTTELSQPTCSPHVEPLQLPSNSASGVIAAVTVPFDLAHPSAISAPAPIIEYLNGIPAVQTQFSKTDLALCSWTKKLGTATTQATITEIASSAIAVQKISVTVLTEVTGKQVVITAPTDDKPPSDVTATPAVAHVENTDTILNAPPTATPDSGPATHDAGTAAAAQNTPQQPQQTAGSTPAGALGVIGILGLPTPSSNGASGNGGAGGSGGSGSINVGGQQVGVSAVSGGAVVVGGQTVKPGQVATVNGAAVSVPAPAAGQEVAPSAVVVNGVTQAVAPAATPAGSINIAGQQVAVRPVPTGAVVIAGQTVQAGQVATINGATISVPAAGSGGTAAAIVVNGITQAVAPGLATVSPIIPLPNPGSPTPLVLTVSGVATTISPTIISGATGSVTAYVLGPGTTLVEGGSALTLPYTTLSIPAQSQTSSGTGISTSTTGGAIGGAIASGIGMNPPATATGFARKVPVDTGLCLVGFFSALFGALAASL